MPACGYTPGATEAEGTEWAVGALEDTTDTDAAALSLKEARWVDFQKSRAYRHARLVADAWCAAFVWPKDCIGVCDTWVCGSKMVWG